MSARFATRWLWLLVGVTPARADDAAPPPVVPDEVIVVDDHAAPDDPAQTHVPAAAASTLPGALGDPVRAMTSLPGISPVSGSRPALYVRGAPPGNTGFFLDGVRVPLLFHSGVASSVVPAALVETLDVFASAAPARYGGIAGGAIDLVTAAPAAHAHVEVVAKAYEAGALVELPLDGGRGSVLAAARLGYPALVTALIDSNAHLSYGDYQLRASWALGERDRVGVLAFGSHDKYSITEAGPTMDMEVPRLDSDFHLVDLRYDHVSRALQLRVALTGGWIAQGAGDVSAKDFQLGARIEAEVPIGAMLRVRTGAQLQRDGYRITLGSDDNPAANSAANADPPPRNLTAGGYVDAVWDLRNDLRVIPGVRFDVVDSSRALEAASATVPVVEPRLAIRWRVKPSFAVMASAGLAHQLPLLRVGNAIATAVTVPGLWAGDTRLQRSRQVSGDVEWQLPAALTVTMTGFASRTRGLSDLQDQCELRAIGPPMGPPTGPATYVCNDARTTGTSYGMEVWLRRALTERLTGSLSYTLSRATEDVRDADGTHEASSHFDRTHRVSGSLAYTVGAGWRLGARIDAFSGEPYTRPASPDGAVPAQDFRLPWYHQLDVRAERRWQLAHGRSLSVVLDMVNATLTRMRDEVTCDAPTDAPPTCTVRDGDRFVVPSVGVEGSF